MPQVSDKVSGGKRFSAHSLRIDGSGTVLFTSTSTEGFFASEMLVLEPTQSVNSRPHVLVNYSFYLLSLPPLFIIPLTRDLVIISTRRPSSFKHNPLALIYYPKSHVSFVCLGQILLMAALQVQVPLGAPRLTGKAECPFSWRWRSRGGKPGGGSPTHRPLKKTKPSNTQYSTSRRGKRKYFRNVYALRASLYSLSIECVRVTPTYSNLFVSRPLTFTTTGVT